MEAIIDSCYLHFSLSVLLVVCYLQSRRMKDLLRWRYRSFNAETANRAVLFLVEDVIHPVQVGVRIRNFQKGPNGCD